MEEQLRSLGFINDQASGVICGYKVEGITVDVMATGKDVLGFSNSWYPDGYAESLGYEIDPQHIIRIFPAIYFIASKLEAFASTDRKYNNDGLVSPDFEDIVYVLENRQSIWHEIR